jgi:protocatechuate 3,4-dioxygenase beta subunit
MKRVVILMLLMLTACGSAVKEFEPDVMLTLGPAPTQPALPPTDIPATQTESANFVPESVPDFLANLPVPSCDSGLTPANMEGPYYKANTPERTSLYEEGMQGKKLILVGYVLNNDCFPIPGVWLDFWQADANGEYDNEGYTLRGHQFTDNKGRYYLETILPGEYPQRPIEHIHVKLQAPNGEVVTTQLYFPEKPVEGLTVQLEDKGDYFLSIYNFVLP